MQFTTTGNAAADSFIQKFEVGIINPLITLLALAAFVLFAWGIVDYIRNAENDEKRKTGQQHILWGLVGMVILFGAAAIVHFLANVANTLFQ